MRKISVMLNDSQYEFAKSKGRLWLRDVVQFIMANIAHHHAQLPLPHRFPCFVPRCRGFPRSGPVRGHEPGRRSPSLPRQLTAN